MNPDSRNSGNYNLYAQTFIPEDRILLKLYQIKSFGVKVPRTINLNYARDLPTNARLDYLEPRVSIALIKKSYKAFYNFLNDKQVDFFYGTFGEKFGGSYSGFYAFQKKTRNMMFFRESGFDMEGNQEYILHSYMQLNLSKAQQLELTHKVFTN